MGLVIYNIFSAIPYVFQTIIVNAEANALFLLSGLSIVNEWANHLQIGWAPTACHNSGVWIKIFLELDGRAMA